MADNPYQNGFSKTWMLFESGNGAVVDLSLFSAPRETTRPIDAYVVTEVEGAVTRSARRAAGAVYDVVSRHRSDLKPVVAGFDFGGPSPVVGESGGLAFAVALAKHLMGKDPGPVAATGIVQSSHNGGPVKAIRGIEAKLEAAAMVLPAGGRVLYPAENEKEIPESLLRHLIDEGLEPHSVSTVAEAIEILFLAQDAESPKISNEQAASRKNSFPFSYVLFLLVVFAATAGLAVWNSEKIEPDSLEVRIPATKATQAEGTTPEKNPPDNGVEVATVTEKSAGDVDVTVADTGQAGIAGRQNGKKEENEVPENGPEERSAGSSTEIPSAVVRISGKTRLNDQISQAISKRLKTHFSTESGRFGKNDQVAISGQVYVLRIEETWMEERQDFRSSLKVVLRDFVYKDGGNTLDLGGIEADVVGDGMVEDLISTAARELTSRVLTSVSAGKKATGVLPGPASSEEPDGGAEPVRKSGFD